MMDFLDNDTLLYIGLIVLFIGFFLWNSNRTKRNREGRKNRNFRKRYQERKKEREEDREIDKPSKTPFPPD